MPRSQVAADGQPDRDGDLDRGRADVDPAGQVERQHDRAVGDRPEDRRVRAVEHVGRAEQDDDAGEVLAGQAADQATMIGGMMKTAMIAAVA